MLLNQRGQVIIFFVLLIPILVVFFLGSVEMAKQIHTKIRVQETLDRGVYAGASYLTEVLNQIALLNRKAHKLFLDRKKDFLKRGSKRSETEAKNQLKETMRQQNLLLDDMEALASNAYPKAYKIARQIIQKEFPSAKFIPLYKEELVLREGIYEELSFATIEGNVFDPKGHKEIPKDGYFLRRAFDKDPDFRVAFAAALEVPALKTILSLFQVDKSFEAVAAAQPFGGSLWSFATHPSRTAARLYRTSMVPAKTLPIPRLDYYEIDH